MKKMSKGRYFLSFVNNLAIFGLALFVVLNCVFNWFGTPIANSTYAITADNLGVSWHQPFKFLPFDITVGTGLVGLICAIESFIRLCSKKDKQPSVTTTTFRLLSAAGEVMVLIYVFALLTTVLKTGDTINWDAICLNVGGPLFVSIVIPALVLINFLFIDLQPKLRFTKSLYGIIVGGVYAIGASVFFHFKPSKDIYFNMFNFANTDLNTIIYWEVGICLSGLILAMILLGFRQLNRQICGFAVKEPESTSSMNYDGEDSDDECETYENSDDNYEEPVFVEKIDYSQPRHQTPLSEKKVIIIKSKKTNTKIMKEDENKMEEEKELNGGRPDAYKGGARVYHISRQPSGKWQVKLANGERAIKLFDTQAQAIDYAKSLVKTQGGSYRVHSMSGKIRKD